MLLHVESMTCLKKRVARIDLYILAYLGGRKKRDAMAYAAFLGWALYRDATFFKCSQ